jgi:hypothetical protein
MKLERLIGTWSNTMQIGNRTYVCSYCDDKVGPNMGYFNNVPAPNMATILICSSCNRPTLFEGNKQSPAPAFGAKVDHLPSDVESLYEEARQCMQVKAYTCAVLGLRTLLSHIAVERGAEKGLSFQAYVTYLVEKGLAPAGSIDWVDSIRERGNEAAHDLEIMDRKQTEQVISFAEMILKFLYEFPARVKPGGS